MDIKKREKGRTGPNKYINKCLSNPRLFTNSQETTLDYNIKLMFVYTYNQIGAKTAKNYLSRSPLKIRAKRKRRK